MDYENFVRKIANDKDIDLTLNGVAEEAGEIFGVIKRMRRGDYSDDIKQLIKMYGIKTALEKEDKARLDLIKEIGDLHYYLTQLLLLLNSNWDHAELLNYGKYYSRKDQGILLGKGSNREVQDGK